MFIKEYKNRDMTTLIKTENGILHGENLTYVGENDLSDLFYISGIKIKIKRLDYAKLTLECALTKPFKIEDERIRMTEDNIQLDGEELKDYEELEVVFKCSEKTKIFVNGKEKH